MIKYYIDALRPLWSRMVTSHCWQKTQGRLLHVKQPFTLGCLTEHLTSDSDIAYGLTFISPGDSTTRVAALDLDDHEKTLGWPTVAEAAERLYSAFEARGIRLIPFRSSGGAGAHLYALWEHAQDAYTVRQTFREILDACGYSVGTKGLAQQQVELFPKQDEVDTKGYGSMIVLPLAGQSVPLDLLDFEPLPRETVLSLRMPLSGSLAARKRSVSRMIALPNAIGLEGLKTMLEAIPNAGIEELPYEDTETGRSYLNVVFALHDATQGSQDGLALALDWASRSAKFNEAKTTNDWHAAGRASSPVTVRTLMQIAAHYGWREPLEHDLMPLPIADVAPLPSFARDKHGKIIPSANNFKLALNCPAITGIRLIFDQFSCTTLISCDGAALRPLHDTDYFELTMRLEQRGFVKVEKSKLQDAVQFVAHENRLDTAIEWLNSATWDGVQRIDTFANTYLGADDTAYTRAVSRYLWTALAGRVLEPGCTAPMVPILVGAQGLRKSAAIEALAPLPHSFDEISLAQTDEENALKLKGLLVVELAELRGLATKDIESIRAFVSRKQERWRQKYDKNLTTLGRRSVFFGTANSSEILADSAGNRRWLPFAVNRVCNDAEIREDLEKLWAEARERFLKQRVQWQEAECLAREMHPRYEIDEPWLPIVTAWINQADDFDGGVTPNTKPYLLTHQILERALHIEKRGIDRKASLRLARIMRDLGYVSTPRWIEGQTHRVWCKP